MKKIAIFTIPGFGHINPFLDITKGFYQAGCETKVYVNKPYDIHFEKIGVSTFALPEPVNADPKVFKPSSQILMERNFIQPSNGIKDVLDDVKKFKPDLIVYDLSSIFGYITSKLLGIEAVSLTIFAGYGILSDSVIPDLDDPINKDIITKNNQYYETFGLNILSENKMGACFPAVNNIFTQVKEFSEKIDSSKNPKLYELLGKTEDNCNYVPPIVNRNIRIDSGKSTELEGISKEKKVIFFSLGSMLTDLSLPMKPGGANSSYEFLEHVVDTTIDALENQTDTQILMCIGKQFQEKYERNYPKNFIVKDFFPQYELLQSYTDGFITHAGLNSVAESLDCGVPMVTIPGFGDQLVNSAKMIEAKCAVAQWELNDFYHTANPQKLLDATRKIIDDPIYKNNSKTIGDELRSRDPVTEIVNYGLSLIPTQ